MRVFSSSSATFETTVRTDESHFTLGLGRLAIGFGFPGLTVVTAAPRDCGGEREKCER